MTLSEKILSFKANKASLFPNEIIEVNVDHTMTYDLFGPSVVKIFFDMGFKNVWDPSKIAVIYDHLVPPKNHSEVANFTFMNNFAKMQGINKLHESDGICHQIMFESGYARPGDIILGTDSHTCTLGAVGAFATGIGYTEMASVWGTGKIWFKVPSSLKFEINGSFNAGVYSKDLILKIIGNIGTAGATYKAIELSGSLIDNLSVSQRLTLCNMAVEAGAKVALMSPDEKVAEHYKLIGYGEILKLKPDPDASYEKIYLYDASSLVPMISYSPSVENVMPLTDIEGEEIRKAFLGSCTNGRLEDLEVAASILKNRKVNDRVEFIVTPASRKVYLEAIQEGIMATLAEAGAIITHPACGLCSGINGGLVADNDTLISSNNRNFLGRMGGLNARVILASPASVAASAIEGKVTDPRKYLK